MVAVVFLNSPYGCAAAGGTLDVVLYGGGAVGICVGRDVYVRTVRIADRVMSTEVCPCVLVYAVRDVTVVGLHLDLYAVEALAVDTVDIALCDECLGVDVLDYSEDVYRLDFSAHHQKHLDGGFAVPSHAVENSAASVCVVVDGSCDFTPFRRYDGELDCLTVCVYHQIGEIGYDYEYHETIHYVAYLVGYEVR